MRHEVRGVRIGAKEIEIPTMDRKNAKLQSTVSLALLSIVTERISS